MYVYTQRDTHTHTAILPLPRQLFYMGNGMNPHLCLDQQNRSSRGSGRGQLHVLTTPEPGLFQGKALCN